MSLLEAVQGATFASIFTEGLSLGIVVVDEAHRIRFWNRWMENHTGIKAREVEGRNLFDQYPDIIERGKDRYIRECILQNRPFLLSPRFHKHLIPISIIKGGERIRMVQNVKLYPAAAEDRAVGAVVILEDLTEQILHEHEISRLNRILKGIRDVNKLITRVRTREELISRTCAILTQEVGYALCWVAFAETDPAVGRPRRMRVRHAAPDLLGWTEIDPAKPGETEDPILGEAVIRDGAVIRNNIDPADLPSRWRAAAEEIGFRSSCVLPLSLGKRRRVGVLGIHAQAPNAFSGDERQLLEEVADDIAFCIQTMEEREIRRRVETEKEMVEAQLRQNQKMQSIGTLAGGIAHDFNNILFPIVGYADMAMQEVGRESKAERYLEQIVKAALRARDLVQQILALGRRSRPVRANLRLQPIVKETLWLLRATTPVEIDIRHRVDEACGRVNADPTQIQQVLMNLCANAHQAMEGEGGELLVCLDEVALHGPGSDDPGGLSPGRYARLTVSDTGRGMEPGIMERIFDPYFTTKGPGQGSGLGLSVVHGIIEQSDGAVRAHSEPGVGSRFEVFLPVAPPPPNEPVPEAEADEVPETP